MVSPESRAFRAAVRLQATNFKSSVSAIGLRGQKGAAALAYAFLN